jgi:TolA-binding protein
LKHFDQAATVFQAVLSNHPNFEGMQDVYLNLGWCQYSLAQKKVEGMQAKAAATFAEMVKKFPQGKFTDQALFFWAESEYALGKKKESLGPYGELVANHPQSPLRADALYALGVTREELGQFAEAGNVYDVYLKEFAEKDLATEVRMRKAETVAQAGDYAAAEKMFAEVAGKAGFASADHALSRQAFCLSKQDKFAAAGDVYAKLATDFKQSAAAKDAAISAGRCFYRADRLPDAAKWLQTAADAGGDGAAEAAHWLCRIHLRNREPQKVAPVVDKALPQAANSPYLVNLQMDQADALNEIKDSKPQALAAYLKIAADHAKHELAPQALYNAAFAALELKQCDDALKRAQAFLKAYPKDRLAPDVKYVAAESCLQLNQHAEAEKTYRELLKSHSDHPESEPWRVRLGLTMFLQKKYSDLVANLSPDLPKLKNPDNRAEAQFLIGASQFQLGALDPAGAALQASLQANPKWRQADETLLYLSRVQRQQNKLNDAIATVRRLLADFPQSQLLDQAHYRLGEYAYAAGDFKTALAEYDAVPAAKGDSQFVPYALYGKAWAQLKSNAYADGAATLTTLLTKHEKHSLAAEARFARVLCRRQSGDLQGAIEDADAYLATNPELNPRCDALYERGLAQVALKKSAEAAATFEELLKANAKYASADKVLYELAWALKSLEEPAQQSAAVARFAKLATEHPDSSLAGEANFHVGEAHYAKKEYAEAARAYAAAKQKAGKGDLDEKATYKLGWSNYQLKQYEAALAEFTEQSQNYPQGTLHTDAAFMKAECLFRQEKFNEALSAYQAAQELKLSSPTAVVLTLLHGGQAASQLKKWEVALKSLEQIPQEHADSPYVPEALYEVGWARQNSGNEAEALKAYEVAAATSRTAVGARARFMIGEVHFNGKQHAEAIRHFQRVMYGYGGDKALDEVKRWQAKAGFEAGRCAEVQIQDAKPGERPNLIADAKKFYQYVLDKHPQDELVPQAQQRLAVLSKL